MATRKSKVSFTLKRFVDFLKVFKRSKRGLFGIVILVFFSAMALTPPLLTTNDPIYDSYVSGDYAAPSWLKQFPGNQYLQENLEVIKEPGFPTRDSLMDPHEWNFTTTETSASVSLQHDPITGHANPGSAMISFMRQAGKYPAGKVRVHLTKEFHYPYERPPKRFACPMAIFTKLKDLQKIEVRVFMKRIEENSTEPQSYLFWVEKFYKDSEGWKLPLIDSYGEYLRMKFGGATNILANPAEIVFPNSTNYVYDVEILFDDSKSGTTGKNVEGTVYIDDLNIRFYGTAYGLLGTDQEGRDIFSQLVWGARISLFVGLFSAVLSVVVGLTFGLIAGYLGKIVDEFVMRFTDMLLVLPTLPLLLVLIAVLGPSIWNLILLIGLLGWMGFARMVRSQVLSLRERPFIEAAKAVGAGKFHIITRHILPNVMSLVYVSLALSVPAAILAEAALSWLGLFDPSVMSWGRMLHDVQAYSGFEKWWWVIPPGISIALVSLSFILLGYALDEILNPKLRKRR